ncbi:MAG TPA: DUF5602 domain-containing protein [Hymenobacter sp.]|uniref:DUF5602 domain-containing protein n=1 Tax=Hymenobacter sp. TaxID=1898978 RepID=UPI002D7E9E36|nr:DUF5602 domain-containing protein [Hymenobacter sp.]HET9504670.1 DUF5602 domain-containing protein [Hymenobacter sp.]
MKTQLTQLRRVSNVATLLVASLGLLAACGKDDKTPQPSTDYGPAVTMGAGKAMGYISRDASGNPTEIGVRFGEAALNGLPATPTTGTMYDIALPPSAAKTPFDHISFDWNPIGHEPNGVYSVPHFDAHFYMQTMSAQHAITLDDPKGDIFPATAKLPTGYATPPNVVPGRTIPMMGRHWTDPASPEYQPGGSFSSTFIYGTYDGRVTFLEPMFTKAMLTTSVNFTAPIKQPQAYEVSGKYYPTNYTIRYDATAKEYVISLGDMILR